MTTTNMGTFLRRITRGMAAQSLRDRSDRQLAELFLADHNDAAFEALVRRHGPMVSRVCWQVLHNVQDVEDAFQATFLLLARNLRTVRKHESLASWLHSVARRVALKARVAALKRRHHELQAAGSQGVPFDQVTWAEMSIALDTELTQLPDKWRQPLVLCYLEGQTQDQAAAQLGWGKNTLRRRLAEAKATLGQRLRRRGLLPATVLGALLVSECAASAAVPTSLLISQASTAAIASLRSGPIMAAVPIRVAALTQGVVNTMFNPNLKLAIVAVVGILLLGSGGVLVACRGNQNYQANQIAVPNEGPANGGEERKPAPLTPAEKYQVILKDYQLADQELTKALQSTKTPEERGQVFLAKYPDVEGYARRFLALARAHSDDPVACDALVWICTYVPQTRADFEAEKSGLVVLEARDALDLLYKNHLGSDKLVPVCHMARSAQNMRNPLSEKFLREVLRKNPHDPVVAQAALSLAYLCRDRAKTASEIKRLGKDSDYYRRIEQYSGKEEMARLLSCDPDELRREAGVLLERLRKDFASIPIYGQKTTFGEQAASLLADMNDLVVGKPAPEIEGENLDGTKSKLSDQRGKITVVVFWATWCHACMTQVPQERALVEKYKDKPFVLVGVNADDDKKGLAESLKKHEITWPSWRDGRQGPIARRWGVASLPAVYILDGKGILRYRDVSSKEIEEALNTLLKEQEASKDAAIDGKKAND